MKTLKGILFTAVAVSFAIFQAACSAGGGGSSGGTTGGTTTAITTSAQAVDASSSNVQAAGMAQGATTTFSNIDKISVASVGGNAAKPLKVRAARQAAHVRLSDNTKIRSLADATTKMAASPLFERIGQKAKAAKAVRANTRVTDTVACTDGGTVDYTATAASADSFSVTLTFNTCREVGMQYDGTITMTGSATSFSYTMGTTGAPFTMYIYSIASGSYSTLVSRMDSVLTMTTTFADTATGYTFTDTSNGTIDMTDYINGGATSSFTFTNLAMAADFDTAGNSDVTLNGALQADWTDAGVAKSVTATFTDFATTTTTTATYQDVSINGTAALSFTPADYCLEGTFTVVTGTAVRYDMTLGYTTQGEMTVNGNTVLTYNADGSITVTVDGTSAGNFTSLADLTGTQCSFPSMNEGSGMFTPDSGAASTTSGGTSGTGVTADALTITSLSVAGAGGSLACYTDLHVNFYNTTTPTASTVGTWFVDWHVNDGCTNPTGFTFEQMRDIDADGICDVGLDINGSDTDDTSGGLEHFSALQLPTGYYVISMNNFSCAADTTNNVSVQVGDMVFGPYTSSYTASGEGETAGAWARVADVRVNADGTVDVLAPDTSLSAWHSGTFGFAAKAPAYLLKGGRGSR